ncbi:MAG: UDP-N-acetylglucosamine 1-carboxyvinyltransferase [Candidatus Coatesbacteria bacterium]|nr:UDP-N-acetylglucosamine 1-carboxyvinyltransferase [Candidatus Coatesbacteria bacterium]
MDKLLIRGRERLSGTIPISGSKNAVLPMMAASLLTRGLTTIRNVPDLVDVHTMSNVLRIIGAKVVFEDNVLQIDTETFNYPEAPYDLVRKMRATYYVLAPLLAHMKKAKVSLPGGCVIGPRPVDQHIKALEALGARIRLEKGYIIADAEELHGCEIFFDLVSVGATAQAMMAATLAKGDTILENVAKEPEVVALAQFLSSMGAKIKGAGSDIIEIKGVEQLQPTDFTNIPDRIETGTYMAAAVITGSRLTLEGADQKNIKTIIRKMREVGATVKTVKNGIEVAGPSVIKPTDIHTHPFPAFPTDMQAQMMAILSVADGRSVITEGIYPERFSHAPELCRLGAQIVIEDNKALVTGVHKLEGASVMASDLRASAALVLAGLVADGETEILRVYHIDRGYEKIEEKLAAVGAQMKRIKEGDDET